MNLNSTASLYLYDDRPTSHLLNLTTYLTYVPSLLVVWVTFHREYIPFGQASKQHSPGITLAYRSYWYHYELIFRPSLA